MKSSKVTSRTHRIIASRYPTIGVFDDIAENEDELRVAFELEAMTNGRLQPYRRLAALPEGGVVTGPTASIAMAAFLHCSDSGGRFNTSRLGAWYAALDQRTAIAETVYHNERRLRMSDAGFPNRIQLRELVVNVDMRCLDLRGVDDPVLYDKDDYAGAQLFALNHRWPFAEKPVDALAYDSVRRDGGENICIFRPTAVPLPIEQGEHFEYVWDAAGELTVLKLTNVDFP